LPVASRENGCSLHTKTLERVYTTAEIQSDVTKLVHSSGRGTRSGGEKESGALDDCQGDRAIGETD